MLLHEYFLTLILISQAAVFSLSFLFDVDCDSRKEKKSIYFIGNRQWDNCIIVQHRNRKELFSIVDLLIVLIRSQSIDIKWRSTKPVKLVKNSMRQDEHEKKNLRRFVWSISFFFIVFFITGRQTMKSIRIEKHCEERKTCHQCLVNTSHLFLSLSVRSTCHSQLSTKLRLYVLDRRKK